MAQHNELGTAGEDFACQYLVQQGYTIVDRNWHFHHLEVDIIANEGQELVFVEVKTRTTPAEPRDVVSDRKIRFLEDAADAYIKKTDFHGDARFDLIMLTKGQGGAFHLDHIKDAFR